MGLVTMADLITANSGTSTFISASDGLRLHACCHGRRSAPALPVQCLPGLARTVADFDVLAASLASHPRRVVALDGSQHLDRAAYDARRTVALERAGLRVIRFPAEDVWGGGLDFICQRVLAACGRASA